MSGATEQVALYRFTHPDGASKDWAITEDATGVTVYFGKTGARLQVRSIPLARCRQHSPAFEAECRVREQRRQGYRALGPHWLDLGNRRTLTPMGSALLGAEPPPEAPPLACYWERRRPRAERLLPSNDLDLLQQAEEILTVLQSHRLVKSWEIGWQCAAWASPWLLRVAIDPDSLWVFGFAAAYRNTPSPAAGESLLDEAGCGRGMISDPTLFAALLFLLALSKRDPHLVVVDETSQIITSVPDDLAVEPDVLVHLGLKHRSIQSLLGGADKPSWFV